MIERRRIDRVSYNADSVMVVREDLKKIYCKVKNLSPLGVAVTVDGDTPSLLGKDVIIVADTLIMYADVIREDPAEDGNRIVALNAKKFTNEVLEYLFEHIAEDEEQ
ncbi:MAG: PilZ domain-containing protein [Lachnospiraceae bacterium]|nr:PilZ domain-containing protein [Lachnospiraceae bacterium]MBO4616930.1 PilZ domain-containing protein [Lachnospiraceae bacterium]MCR4678477.1 PilZ domain-containing protein [Lachnospiraceae bacterium]